MSNHKTLSLFSTVLSIAMTLLALGLTSHRVSAQASNAPNQAEASPETSASYVQYLANAGVLVVNGDTKIAFDPIFRMGFGAYLLLPEELERSLFAGEAPFDGLDAVFISHYHGDHFSARDVFRLMASQPELELYAPTQAVEAMRAVDRSDKETDGSTLFERVYEIALEYEQSPVTIERQGLLVEAVRIPHSGWPSRMQEVENIAFRVSLQGAGNTVTAAHLGDADTRDDHYDQDADYWAKRPLHVALPPYWYLQTEDGRSILTNRLKPALTLGVHVPKNFSDTDKTAVTSDTTGVLTEPLERRSIQP